MRTVQNVQCCCGGNFLHLAPFIAPRFYDNREGVRLLRECLRQGGKGWL